MDTEFFTKDSSSFFLACCAGGLLYNGSHGSIFLVVNPKDCETIAAEACVTLSCCDDSALDLWDPGESLLPVFDELLLEFGSPPCPRNPKLILCETF